MKRRDFCFWLQGFFELSEASGLASPAAFPSRALDCVRKHLELVKRTEGRFDGFPAALRVLIDGQEGLSAAEIAVVRKLLAAEFVHWDGDVGESDGPTLDEIHGQGPGGVVFRC